MRYFAKKKLRMMRTTFAQVVAAQAKVCTTVLFAENAKVLVVIPKAITRAIMNNWPFPLAPLPNDYRLPKYNPNNEEESPL